MRSRLVSPRLSARLALLAALAGAALGAPSLLSSGQPPPPARGAPAAAPPGGPPAASRAAAQAQPPPSSVTIESHKGQTPKIKLALPPFRPGNLGGDLAAAGGELEATVRADLDFSGYFKIQGAEAWRAASLSGDVERDLPAYRGPGAQVVLLGG